MELYEEIGYRADEVERNRENRARTASVFAKYKTTGQGSFEFRKRVEFGCSFVDEPTVAYGSTVDIDAISNQLNIGRNSRNDVPLPLTSGMVTSWDTDANDFYIGCWVAARVYWPVPLEIVEFQPYAEDPTKKMDFVFPALGPNEVPVPIGNINLPVGHHFTFTGTALKDVPVDQND